MDCWWRGEMGWCWWKDAVGGWVLYSQLRIEDVQVAQIVCVVGRAEPGQDQQQQSLHGQRSALFPLFFPLPLLSALKLSPLLFPPPPPPPPPPPILRTWPCWPPSPPPRLPSFSRGALRSELILHFLPFQPLSFHSASPSLYLCVCVSLAVFFLCLRLAAWSSQLQRQTGHLPEVEDGAEEEEAAAEAGAEEKSRCGTGGRGESARRRGRRPMQRWHIWNTIWDVQPLNLLWALASCKRICARMRVCACLSPSVCACVRVCMSERTAQAVTYTAAETTEGGDGADQTKTGGGGRYLVLLWLALPSSHAYTQAHTRTHAHTHTHGQPLHSPPPCLHICWSVKGRRERRGGNMLSPNPHPSSPTMDCSPCSRLVWSLKRICLHVWKKNKKKQSMTKTHRQINILCSDGSLLFWVTWKRTTEAKNKKIWNKSLEHHYPMCTFHSVSQSFIQSIQNVQRERER